MSVAAKSNQDSGDMIYLIHKYMKKKLRARNAEHLRTDVIKLR